MGAVETKIEGHGSLGNGGKPFDAAAAAYFGAYYLFLVFLLATLQGCWAAECCVPACSLVPLRLPLLLVLLLLLLLLLLITTAPSVDVFSSIVL